MSEVWDGMGLPFFTNSYEGAAALLLRRSCWVCGAV